MTTRNDAAARRGPGAGAQAHDHRRVFAEFARALAGALAQAGRDAR